MMTRLENLMRNTKALQSIYYSVPLPIMSMVLNLRALSLARLRYSKVTFSYLETIMKRDEWSEAMLSDYIQEQSVNMIRIAMEIPHYKNIVKGVSSLGEFPVLTRSDVRNNYMHMVIPDSRSLIRVFTSGSSGSGLPVYYDQNTYSLYWAYLMKQKMWAGVDPRESRITFFGALVVSLDRKKPPFWLKNHFEKQYLMSIFHISDKNAEHYVRFLDENQGLVLEGFPSVLYLIAQYVKALKGSLKFKAIFSTGEPLYPFMRKEIEDTFGAKVYDSYGMTELGGFIFECERGGYHVLTDFGSLEIVCNNGETAKPNEEGFFIWTGFINSAMPFIRYKIGDMGMWEKKQCSCGRPYPLVKPTITRDSDFIITPDGKILSPRAINQVLKNKVSFKACQFIQNKTDEIVVRIVPDTSRDFRNELKELQKSIGKIVGSNVSILEEVAEEPIRRGSQGKIPLILSQVNYESINRKRVWT